MSQAPPPDVLEALIEGATDETPGGDVGQGDVTQPAESSTPTSTRPSIWSASYAVHAILPDGTHAMVPCSGLSWEEQAGELAARITLQFPAARLDGDGELLSNLIVLGTPLTILAAFGSNDYKEVVRGLVEEVSPNDGTGGTFEVVAYEPIKALLNNKINAYYPAEMPIADILRNVLGGHGIVDQPGFNVPIGDLDGAVEAATLKAPKTYHAQTLADILTDLVKEAQVQVKGNDRLVILSREGVISVGQPGTNTDVYWVRQDLQHSNLLTVRERISITDLSTKLVVVGKSDSLGEPGVIMTVDATDTNFGITRQDILEISQYMTPEDVQRQAQLYFNTAGAPIHDRTLEVPDIPFVRKYDRIRVTAGTLDDWFSVETVQHEEATRVMNLGLGTLHSAPDIGTATPLDQLHTEFIPDPQSTGGGGGGGGGGFLGHLTDSQLYAVAKQAGFTGNAAIMAVAISLAEDGTSDPTARHLNDNKTIDLGLWQINSIHWGGKTPGVADEQALQDPVTNAKAAYIISSGGTNWGPWATYPNAYVKYMDRAKAASVAPPVPVPSGGAASAPSSAAINSAMSEWANVKYQLGGSSKSGVDCSAFTQAVYSKLGVNLPRTAQSQWNSSLVQKVGTPAYGDLVFFQHTYASSDQITHVGIYVGNGQMISADPPQVQRESFQTQNWKSHFVGYGHVTVPNPNAS